MSLSEPLFWSFHENKNSKLLQEPRNKGGHLAHYQTEHASSKLPYSLKCNPGQHRVHSANEKQGHDLKSLVSMTSNDDLFCPRHQTMTQNFSFLSVLEAELKSSYCFFSLCHVEFKD